MISLAEAQKLVTEAQAEALKLGVTVTVTVVDASGRLVLASRMDGALIVSPEISFNKAFTSAALSSPTHAIAEYTLPGKPYFGLQDMMGGRLTAIAGGLPLTKNGKTIGGIGVGGSMDTQQDLACAQAAVDALNVTK